MAGSNREKTIYFVTVFNIPHDQLEVSAGNLYKPPEGWSSMYYKRSRCWGWWAEEKDAEACIAENWTDIYENGYYNLAVIEPMKQGPCGYVHRKDRWFKVGYREDGYDIEEIPKPLRLKQVVGWSYA
jgi:hypothetical protein